VICFLAGYVHTRLVIVAFYLAAVLPAADLHCCCSFSLSASLPLPDQHNPLGLPPPRLPLLSQVASRRVRPPDRGRPPDCCCPPDRLIGCRVPSSAQGVRSPLLLTLLGVLTCSLRLASCAAGLLHWPC
jgi:hypothetical protein